MNVNNNINNNPIHQAPGAGQANAPVNAPNIQQVAAHPAPQGMDHAPAAWDMGDNYGLHEGVDPQGMDHAPAAGTEDTESIVRQIEQAIQEGRTHDAVQNYCMLDKEHPLVLASEIAQDIANNWNNGDQEHIYSSQPSENPVLGYYNMRFIEVQGGISVFADFWCALPSDNLQNDIIKIIAEKQDLEIDFKREVVENFMSDENPDKAELLLMCQPRRFHTTKSARK